MGLQQTVVVVARAIEERFDRFRFGAKRRFGLLGRLEILPYRGHGTSDEIFLKGRVLEETGITRSGQTDTIWQNLRNMIRRFGSAEVAGARVRATFDGIEVEVTADHEGFFDVRFEPEGWTGGTSQWLPVELRLLAPASPGGGPVGSVGEVLVPRRPRFGVISDLDDTVVMSNATNVLKMAWIVLRNNAHTRLPFEGVAAFYHALRRGPDGDGDNPIFYVSSSPWNIYDVLEDFLDVHGVPAGPMFLKDWSPTVLGDHEEHKLGAIRTLLRTYPELPFVLIGDSGERDPEIYRQAALEHPGRIPAVYIRDVTTPERDAEVQAIAREVADLGTVMIAVKDTALAAEHATSIGLVSPGSADRVRASRGARGPAASGDGRDLPSR